MSISLEQAAAGMDDATAQAERVVQDAILFQAQSVIGPIQRVWPVDTGSSRRAWAAVRTVDGAAVVNGEEYASEVHNGLADTLVPAMLQTTEPQTVTRIEEPLTNALELT